MRQRGVSDLHGFIQVKLSAKTNKIKVDPVNVPLNVPLNERQNNLIQDINKNKSITQTELAKKCKVNRETIKRDLQYLQEKNIIKRVGSKKTGYWEVVGNV